MSEKPTHVKPAFYSYVYEILKRIAKTYGYNLLLNGSMNRDLDLIAVPWRKRLDSVDKMINDFCDVLDGELWHGAQIKESAHGRKHFIINLSRTRFERTQHDPEWYLDISVFEPKDKPCTN